MQLQVEAYNSTNMIGLYTTSRRNQSIVSDLPETFRMISSSLKYATTTTSTWKKTTSLISRSLTITPNLKCYHTVNAITTTSKRKTPPWPAGITSTASSDLNT